MAITHEQAVDALNMLSDEELSNYKFYAPYNISGVPEEGDALINRLHGIDRKEQSSKYYRIIQDFLWEKFQENPWMNTTVTDYMGRLTGRGFSITSPIFKINEYIKKIYTDPRNKLYENLSKYVARQRIEGELYIVMSVHPDGFVELDFLDPGTISGGNRGTGKFLHPTKPGFVLAYEVNGVAADGQTVIHSIIPSINLMYYPEMYEVLKKNTVFSEQLLDSSVNKSKKFKKLGGFDRFIIEWDCGLFINRNVSSLRTVLEWIEHYEELKKYEIEHKKAAGSYLWAITIQDPKAFRNWLAMSDSDRKKTGIMEQYIPGGKIVLPPGMDIKAINPTLPNISGSDTDILHMVTAGLNAPEDIVTGESKGTFASVKASRAPQSDRTADNIEFFERFLRYTFFRPIFFAATNMGSLSKKFKVREAVDFIDKKPVFKDVNREPHELLEFTFPVSELSDQESIASATLGVKHGAITDMLGVPASSVAEKMGYGNYRTCRLKKATEDDIFPELQPAIDQESNQEITTGETPKTGIKKKPKVTDPKGGTKEQSN